MLKTIGGVLTALLALTSPWIQLCLKLVHIQNFQSVKSINIFPSLADAVDDASIPAGQLPFTCQELFTENC